MIRNAAFAALLATSSLSFAQTNVLFVGKPDVVSAKAGATIDTRLPLELRSGYHVNSNTPSDPYLIPLRLTWNPGPLTPGEIAYPKPSMEKYSFSEKPLSVFSGRFELKTRFAVPAGAPPGLVTVAGKLRYQACNDRECLSPKTIDVALKVDVVK